MSAVESNKLSRRLLLAGAAIGLAFTSAPAGAQTPEKVTFHLTLGRLVFPVESTKTDDPDGVLVL